MKISYETHYKSSRADGRHTATMAAFLERLRNTPAELSMPEDLNAENFEKWRNDLKLKVRELLKLDVLDHFSIFRNFPRSNPRA